MPPKGLTLPDALAEKVRRGAPLVSMDQLPDEGPATEPGRSLLLIDGAGQVLGTALSDPENEVVRVYSREGLERLDADFFEERVKEAAELRRALGLHDGRSAFRLINAEGDGLSGFVADVFGEYVVLYVYSRGWMPLAQMVAEAIIRQLQPRGVVVKVRPKGGVKPGKIKQRIFGEEPPEKLVVQEEGVPYEVHLLSGLNVGLFTDLREQRQRLQRFVHGKRVLNTFAYTCALSVSAARAGAQRVVSVDLSSGVLKWGRENFRLSGLDPEDRAYGFEVSDVSRYLRRVGEEREVFDTIILDPPTYSAARASAWSMKNDYPDMIRAAAGLLPTEAPGFLWVSANTHRNRQLARQIRDALDEDHYSCKVLEVSGLPPDYPTPLAYPEARYLEVHWLEVRRA